VTRGTAREIVLVNRTRKTAAAVATDIRYGLPLSPRAEIRDGDYADLDGCGVVMITSGINEKTGGATDRGDKEGRLKLLDKNAEIYRDIVPRIVKAAPEAVLLVVTDPPDPLADVARMAAGHARVISAGTYLDTQRFRVHLAQHFEVDPASVEAQVLGEHGTSQVFAWSTARVGGVPVADLLKRRGEDAKAMHEKLEKDVRYANITIIEGNEASQFGIAIVSCRIAEMILKDERAAIPIGSYHEQYGVTLSLPSVVGRDGIAAVLAPALSAEENTALTKSAESIAKALQRVKG
jgi:L-lactate dehydrogenase